MTDKQFYIIRNLLSWIVVALFLLVSRHYLDVTRLELAGFIGKVSLMIVAGFTLMILIRMMIFVDPEKKKTPQPEASANNDYRGNDDELNLNGTFKK